MFAKARQDTFRTTRAPALTLLAAAALGSGWAMAADTGDSEPVSGFEQPGQELETIEPEVTGSGTKELPTAQTDELPAVQKDELPAVQEEAPAGLEESPAAPELKEQAAPKLEEQVSPELKEQVSPELKEQVAPELKETLPSRPENVQTTAGEPEITRLSRDRAEIGHRIRIEGRFFGPEPAGRGVEVQTEDIYGGTFDTALDVLRWSGDEIRVRIPPSAQPGAGVIRLLAADGRVLSQAPFEVVKSGGSLGTAGADLGGSAIPDEPSSGGGFTPKSIDLEPELYFGELPSWTRFETREGAFPGGLHYGAREEVRFTVVNDGEREARFRAGYQIEAQAPDVSSVMRLAPGEEKAVSMEVDLGSLSPAAEARIRREHELTIRIFVANGEPTGRYNYSALLYRDGRAENHTRVADIRVRSGLEVSVELDRMRQHDLCDNWAQKRDWMFLVYTPAPDGSTGYHQHELAGKPPFLEGSVRAEHALSPPVRYRLVADWHRDDFATTPLLFALKDNGNVKNSGRAAAFEIRKSLDSLASLGSTSGWVRSRDRGGTFCGTDLEVRYRLRAELVAPRG